MAKTFKPGQLITIDNVVYQVRKTKLGDAICINCAIHLLADNTYQQIEQKMKICFRWCGINLMRGATGLPKRIPMDCYLKRITP